MPTALQLKAMWLKFHSVPYNPLTPNSPYSLPNDSHYVGLDNSVPDQLVISFGTRSISNLILDIFLYSHHLSP